MLKKASGKGDSMNRNRDQQQRYRSDSGSGRQKSYQGYGAGYTGSQNQGYTMGNEWTRGNSRNRSSFAGQGGYGGGYQGYDVDSDYKGSNDQGMRYRSQSADQNYDSNRNAGYEGPTSDWLPNNYRRFDQGYQGSSSAGRRGSWETGQSWSNQYQPYQPDRYYSEGDTNDRTPHFYGTSRYRYDEGSLGAYDGQRREPHGVWEEVKNFFGFGPKGYKRSDERIREDVSEALYRAPEVNASDIEVEVQDGLVTLKGTVTERRMKRLAEDCAADVSGVDDVRNEIRVQQAASMGSETSTATRSTEKMSKSRTDRLM
jgi:hypothetical protein